MLAMGSCSAFASYAVGLATTILVMNHFSAAQPALLYIVPSVLGGVGIHALLKREFKLVSDGPPAQTLITPGLAFSTLIVPQNVTPAP